MGWLGRLAKRRHRRLPGGTVWLQAARRTVQLAVLLLIVGIPVLSNYDNLRNQHDAEAIAARFDSRWLDAALRDLEHPESISQAVRGSVWTLKVNDTIVSDPLAGVDFATASRTLLDPFLLTLLLPVLASALLGRVFCGWICPADLLFELGSKIRGFMGIERDVPFSRKLKYALLFVGAAAALLTGQQVFPEIYPPRVLSGELYLGITFGAIGAGAWFLLVVVAFELFVSKRFWCRYVCPGGALYSLLGRFRVVRLKVSRSTCTGCDKCTPVCEFGLDPMAGNVGQECNNCGLCIRACGPGALSFQVELPKRRHLDVLP